MVEFALEVASAFVELCFAPFFMAPFKGAQPPKDHLIDSSEAAVVAVGDALDCASLALASVKFSEIKLTINRRIFTQLNATLRSFLTLLNLSILKPSLFSSMRRQSIINSSARLCVSVLSIRCEKPVEGESIK